VSVAATVVDSMGVTEKEEERKEEGRLYYRYHYYCYYCYYCYCCRWDCYWYYLARLGYRDIPRRHYPGGDARTCSSDTGTALLPFECGAGWTTVGCSLRISGDVEVLACV